MLYLIALFVLAGLLLFVPLPITPTYFGRTIENAGHTPLFFLLTLGLLFVLRTDPRFSGARLYAVAGLVGAGTGFLSEVIQRPLARDASWEDVAADALGVVLALAAYAMFERRSALRRWHRASAFVVALGCVAIFLVPIVRMTRAYVHRNGQFPVLADFHSSIELYWTVSIGVNRVHHRRCARGRIRQRGISRASRSTSRSPTGGVTRRCSSTWKIPTAGRSSSALRVHDRQHTRAFADRYNRSFELDPGERRTLSIPLEDIRRGPRHRLMDMAHISDITLFQGAPAGSRVLRIYSLRLE